jgi:hypothetical protein
MEPKKQPHFPRCLDKTAHNTEILFLHRLRVRIRADFERLDRGIFNGIWAGDNFPVTANQSGTLFIGL